jgi:hypothetical protein
MRLCQVWQASDATRWLSLHRGETKVPTGNHRISTWPHFYAAPKPNQFLPSTLTAIDIPTEIFVIRTAVNRLIDIGEFERLNFLP